MTQHKVGTQEEWQAARDELLAEEKELTRRNDELTRKRQDLPWVPVEEDYRFETVDGTKSLADLSDGRSQLLIYTSCSARITRAGARSARRSRTTSTRTRSTWRRGTRS